jgi:uncharacterized protein (DUF2252 family)
MFQSRLLYKQQDGVHMNRIILHTITKCNRNGILCRLPLHNTLHTGHSTVSRRRRRSLAVLDSRGQDKHLSWNTMSCHIG